MKRRSRINLMVALWFFGIWGLGAFGFIASQDGDCCTPRAVISAAYKSLQMFGLNFDLEPRTKGAEDRKETPMAKAGDHNAMPTEGGEDRIHVALEAARFLAAGFSFFTAILLISRPWRTWLQVMLQVMWFWRPRVIVFGYGSVGRAIARHLQTTNTVTVVDVDLDGTKRSSAVDDGVLFVEGDGSDPSIIRSVRPSGRSIVVIAHEDDMRSLDVAKAFVAAHPPSRSVKNGPGVRLILKSRSLARDLAVSQLSRLDALDRVSIFALPDMAAIRLCETARFDRVALEARQPGVQVVLVGCGDLGEAVLTEVLLTAWRIGSAPPKVTVVDPCAEVAKARVEAFAPALFIPPGRPGALPRASLPEVVFKSIELTAANAAVEAAGISSDSRPVTAYVIATGNDMANVEIGMALERAMMRADLSIAPIHVRLSNEYRGDTPDLGLARIALISPFGSLESIAEYGRAFDKDPDFIARRIHTLYRRAKQKVFPTHDEPRWEELSATLKESNRRLFRHAIQKLEDLGLQARATKFDHLPISGSVAREMEQARQDLENRYADIADLRGEIIDRPYTLVERIERSAVLEHDRWMTERALDGWRAAASAMRIARNDAKKLHNYICEWKHTDEGARKYDTLLLWALTTIETAGEPSVFARKVGRVWLSLDRNDRRSTWASTADFEIGEDSVTELAIGIGQPNFGGADVRSLADLAASQIAGLVERAGSAGCLVRVHFHLNAPCDDGMLKIVGSIASRLENFDLDVTATWRWIEPQPLRIGFVGHRDLERVGGEAAARRAIEHAFTELALSHPSIALFCGLAPGADQLAVSVWNRMGLRRPSLVLPFLERSPSGGDDHWTDEPHTDGARCFSASTLGEYGEFTVASREEGEEAHEAQARHILEHSDLLIALWDGVPSDRAGGTAATVAKAKAKGMAVRVLVPRLPSSMSARRPRFLA